SRWHVVALNPKSAARPRSPSISLPEASGLLRRLFGLSRLRGLGLVDRRFGLVHRRFDLRQWFRDRRKVRHDRPQRPPPLLDPGRATGPTAQVIELRAARLAGAHHLDLVDAGRMDQEGPLDADAVGGDPANGKVLVDATAATANDDALEHLDSF